MNCSGHSDTVLSLQIIMIVSPDFSFPDTRPTVQTTCSRMTKPFLEQIDIVVIKDFTCLWAEPNQITIVEICKVGCREAAHHSSFWESPHRSEERRVGKECRSGSSRNH